MISLNVLRKNIRCWQIPLKLSLQQRSFGTNESMEKILSRQRAMVAHRILSLILEGKKEEQFFLSSIVCDEIKKETELKDIFEQHFEHLFDPQKGVKLPPYLTTQRRITQAYNKSHNIQNIPKVPFFPNRLVSSEVFKAIQKNNIKSLIMGKPGIAKTTSLILYAYLSSIANEYKYIYDDKEFQTFPFLLYFSYQSTAANLYEYNYLQKGWEDFKNCVKAQHLNKQQTFKEETSEKQLVQKIINECNQKNIKVKFVIDQFNTLVKHIQSYNKMNEQYPSKQRRKDISQIIKSFKQEETQIKQLKKNEKQNKNKITDKEKVKKSLMDQLDEISKIQYLKKNLQKQIYIIGQIESDGLILNSSKNVEEDLLLETTYSQELLTMGFLKHDGVTTQQIAYQENVQKEWGKRELIRMFIFEALKYTDKKLSQQIMFSNEKLFEQKKKQTNSHLSQNQQNQQRDLINVLYQEIKTKDQIFTFLQIRQFMEDRKEQLEKINEFGKLKQFLKKQIKSIQNLSNEL